MLQVYIFGRYVSLTKLSVINIRRLCLFLRRGVKHVWHASCIAFRISARNSEWLHHEGVGGVKVSMVAFQAADPGSIPGWRILFCHYLITRLHISILVSFSLELVAFLSDIFQFLSSLLMIIFFDVLDIHKPYVYRR